MSLRFLNRSLRLWLFFCSPITYCVYIWPFPSFYPRLPPRLRQRYDYDDSADTCKGDFVDTLLQVVAMDDVIGLVLYSIAISIAPVLIRRRRRLQRGRAADSCQYICFDSRRCLRLHLKFLMPRKRSADNQLIISVALLLRLLRRMRASGGIASAWLHVHGDGLYERYGRR